MKQITLRSIPDEIEKAVKKEAKAKGLSLNKAFLSLLGSASGVSSREKKKETLHRDLDYLSGVWTKDDLRRFNTALEFQRKIDERLWKKTG